VVFNSLQLLREEWKLNLSKSFTPVGDRKQKRLQSPATAKTPAVALSFEERIALRKYTPHTGIHCCDITCGEDGEEEDNNSEAQQQDFRKHNGCSSSTSSSSATSSSSSLSSAATTAVVTASDGTAIKIEGTHEEVIANEPSGVIVSASMAPPLAKKTKKGGPQQ